MAMELAVSLIASPIIGKITEEAKAFATRNFDQLYGVESEIERLSSNLSAISAVLEDAEKRLSETDSRQLRDWLTKLKDAALDIEDILQLYATEAVLREKRKLRKPVAWLHSRSNAAEKIKQVVSRIEMISKENEQFHFRMADYGGSALTPETTSIDLREMDYLRDTSDVIGRDDERDEIVRWLVSDADPNHQGRVPVLLITGMGGLGKTTLAQLVYNDERIYQKKSETSHFKVGVWVNVSVDSSVDAILKNIVESLTEMRHDSIPQSSIITRILEVLDGRRFLLVLDDVWVERLSWEPIHRFLQLCPTGSKVLVTSRNAQVGRFMDATSSHPLGQLPEDKCWELFAKRAFVSHSYSAEFEDIGREIIRKCEFLPLAVKAMAGLLRGSDDIRRWQRILKNGVWESEQSNASLGNGTPNILPALKLSYDHLPSQLKQCFAYCCLFQKGYMFDKNELVKLWLAEGYIHTRGENQNEDTGRDYFDQLLTRSFFQLLDIDNKVWYKMHDLIHDLAKSVSSACGQVEEDKACSIARNSRHVSFVCKDVKKPVAEMLKARKLRTLLLPISHARDFGIDALDKMFRTLSYLRVLDLSSSNTSDLPKSIGALKLLRYLDLSRTDIRMLPNTMCNLINLQTLKLLGCVWLLELPKDLGSLKNLQYLELDEMFWFKCSKIPPGIGGLTALRNLSSFIVLPESGYGIEELQNLNNLEGTLHISKLENSTNAISAQLTKKDRINKLILEWTMEGPNPQDRTMQESVLQNLEPHRNLQELIINHYKGSRISTWMGNGMLSNLQKLSLKHCVNCRILALGQLPRLQELVIKGLLELVEWPDTQYQSLTRLTISKCPQLREIPRQFLHLRVLKIKQCDELKGLPIMLNIMFMSLINNSLLEEWHEKTALVHVREDGGLQVRRLHSYQNLLELKLVNCPRLPELPWFFAPQKLETNGCTLLRTLPPQGFSQRLQCLTLQNCIGTSLIEAIPSTNSLYSLIISNIINMARLPRLPNLTGLQALYIHNCYDLESFSHADEPFQSLSSLKILSVRGCQKLVNFPNGVLPTSIDCLYIEDCGNLRSFNPPNCLASLSSLKDLYLESCPKLQSLPEDGLPASLQHLCIRECPILAPQCNQGTGHYWPMIRDIADVELEIPTPAARSGNGARRDNRTTN